MDNTKNFNQLADNYTVGRPTYAKDFINSLYMQYGFNEESVIADIGAGTGKFSKQLLDRGSTVYGVEPNDDMRNTAIKELGKYHRFHAVNGTAADTKMDSESVDFDGKYEYIEFNHPISYDVNMFISRSLSGSYSLKNADKDYDKYIEELYKLYEQYAKNDRYWAVELNVICPKIYWTISFCHPNTNRPFG